MNLNRVLREVNIEILTKTIYLTGGFVAKEFRGNRLLGTLMTEITERLLDENPEVVSACTHVFGSNIPSLKTCEKLGFVILTTKQAINNEINNYLPSNVKHLLINKYK